MANDKKAETKIFSIDEGEWNNEIPGVTRLITLNAQEMKKLKEVTSLIPAPKHEAPAPAAAVPAANAAEVKKETVKPAKFSDLGIFVEHQYRLHGNRFVYQKSISHDGSPISLQSWQNAILDKMEIDHKIVKSLGAFHEYPMTQKVMSEIFAGTAPAFVQMVRVPATGDALSVFQSTQTCLIKREVLLNLVDEAQKTAVVQDEPSVLIEPTSSVPSGAKVIELKNGDDDKIELDVA